MRDAFARMMDPLRRRVALMIGRAVLTLVNDAGGRQIHQVSLLNGEMSDNLESFDHYGFTSVPFPGAEGVFVSVGGERTHGLIIATGDRRFRLKGLQNGEVALYDDLGHQIYLTRTGIVINGAGQQVTIENTPLVLIESTLHVTGDVLDNCNSQPHTVATMRSIYNGHTHGGVQAGGATTATPGASQ